MNIKKGCVFSKLNINLNINLNISPQALTTKIVIKYNLVMQTIIAAYVVGNKS